jgi:hypothetical protein
VTGIKVAMARHRIKSKDLAVGVGMSNQKLLNKLAKRSRWYLDEIKLVVSFFNGLPGEYHYTIDELTED